MRYLKTSRDMARQREATRDIAGYPTDKSHSEKEGEKMRLQEAKREANLRKWREEVYNCRSSGQTVVGWCRERGITPKTYYRWQKLVWEHESGALAERAAEQSKLVKTGTAVSSVAFEAVPLIGSETEYMSSAGITIRRGEWAVEVQGGADILLLRQILEMLG